MVYRVGCVPGERPLDEVEAVVSTPPTCGPASPCSLEGDAPSCRVALRPCRPTAARSSRDRPVRGALHGRRGVPGDGSCALAARHRDPTGGRRALRCAPTTTTGRSCIPIRRGLPPGVINVLPMTAEELEAAVVGPAERVGVRSSRPWSPARRRHGRPAGCVAAPAVRADGAVRPAAGRQLTLDDYSALGGLAGVLTRRAEDALRRLEPGGAARRRCRSSCAWCGSARGRDSRRRVL